MCALIYQYKEIIIEDNKYLYATITNYLTIAKNKSLLKQGHRVTKNHGEMIDCITHHVCQEIQGVDEMVLMKVLMLVLMMPLPEGGGVHRRRFRQRFPPPISAGGGLLTPFYVFSIYAAVPSRYASGEPYIVRFRSRRVGGTKIEAKRTSEGRKSPGGAPKGDGRASPYLSLFPAPFASFKSSMSSVLKFPKRGL